MGKYTIKTREYIIEPIDEENIWEGDWAITFKPKDEDPVKIGRATFAGEKMLGAIPIYVELDKEYQNKKHGTEVFKLLIGFAFGFGNIYEIKAETEVENDKARYALEKAGFVHRSTSHGIESFSITKPKTAWLGLYAYIGVLAGLALGIVVGSTWVGLIIGIVIGLGFGTSMDAAARKKREEVTGQK